MELSVGNLPMAETPHQNLHTGAVREFHLIMTFEFSVHRENMVVRWLSTLLYHCKHRKPVGWIAVELQTDTKYIRGRVTKLRSSRSKGSSLHTKRKIHSLCEKAIESVRSNQFGELMPHHKLPSFVSERKEHTSVQASTHLHNRNLTSLNRARWWKRWMWHRHNIRNSMSTWRTCKEPQAVRKSF
jgi:hypothetical protein